MTLISEHVLPVMKKDISSLQLLEIQLVDLLQQLWVVFLILLVEQEQLQLVEVI